MPSQIVVTDWCPTLPSWCRCAGLGILTNRPNSTFWFKPSMGFAFTARVGVSPWTFEKHRFGASLEFVPGFYENQRAIGLALNLEWQLF